MVWSITKIAGVRWLIDVLLIRLYPAWIFILSRKGYHRKKPSHFNSQNNPFHNIAWLYGVVSHDLQLGFTPPRTYVRRLKRESRIGVTEHSSLLGTWLQKGRSEYTKSVFPQFYWFLKKIADEKGGNISPWWSQAVMLSERETGRKRSFGYMNWRWRSSDPRTWVFVYNTIYNLLRNYPFLLVLKPRITWQDRKGRRPFAMIGVGFGWSQSC